MQDLRQRKRLPIESKKAEHKKGMKYQITTLLCMDVIHEEICQVRENNIGRSD